MTRLIYDTSEVDANLLYATGFHVPDPCLYFEKNRRKYLVLNSLEYDRGRREANVDHVINLSDITRRIRKKKGASRPHQWILETLRMHRIRSAEVSPFFSIGVADFLRKGGIRISVAKGSLYPQRECKSAQEIRHLRESLRVTSELLRAAIHMIRSSRPSRSGILKLGGSPLTSERVHALIRMEAARHGFKADSPIVAGGIQACDPHERGHGPLKANQLIILDIFPRCLKSGYWGDMTRTVLKGRATDAQRKLFHTVHQAQKLAFENIRHGIQGSIVHQKIQDLFKGQGYETGNSRGRYEGFFHGTGHGLGLDIHEAPRVGASGPVLQKGNVVTVEPGLYYGRIGGVRIEDVVLVRKNDCEKLSRFPVSLEIN